MRLSPSARGLRCSIAAPAVIVGVVALAAACGTNSGAERGTLQALAARATHGSLAFGTGDYAPGDIRISFVLLRPDGSLVTQRHARVWLAESMHDRPLTYATAKLESTSVPGANVAAGGSSRLYVAHLHVAKPGQYTILVQPQGGAKLAALDQITVAKQTRTPALGSAAAASTTPTITSSRGQLRRITTHVPPDRELLRYSVADSLKAHAPFVLVFASPAFCPNRTCGPIVDVVDAVRRRFAQRDIRFIHVEPYRDNNPGLGFNQFARQWHLPSEPFTFLVGGDGRIKGKFEGSLSAAELSAAIRRQLPART
jgi:hypothetical protein